MTANPNNNFEYNKNLQPFAQKLRSNMTKAEASLWKYVLRAGALKGYHFRKQRPVLNYIADFMCKELMLVIEVDGITHGLPNAVEKDKERQMAIEACGFVVLRFTDDEILTNIKGVHSFLENWIEIFETANPSIIAYKRQRKNSPSCLRPPPQGEDNGANENHFGTT